MVRMRALRVLAMVAVAGVLCGCAQTSPSGEAKDFVKPTVAVMKFENRASFPMHWDLGSGTRDVLVDRLMRTGRYHVIERPELSEVLKELNLQQSGVTRANDKAALGRIKNVQYLIKGTIIDFSQVSGASVGARKGMSGIFGSDSRAIVSIILYVVDVESGEILASESIEESVHASDASVQTVYNDISFGGSAFYNTPLGEATEKVIDRAVAKITDSVANQRWTAKIAAVQAGGSVLLNGGADRKIVPGEQFTVMEEGPAVVDPETGDSLGRQAPRAIGTVRVTVVHDRYCEATAEGVSGPLRVGLCCRRGE